MHKSLSFILTSIILICGPTYLLTRAYKKKLAARLSNPDYNINLIVQTGPEKRALPTTYLAELLNLSTNNPQNLYNFSIAAAEKKLLASPVIASAQVRPIKPSALYIDYTTHKPIARLGNRTHTGIDATGHTFPLTHLSPKNLPELFLPNPDHLHTALDLIHLLSQPPLFDLQLQRIDLTDIDAPSAGRRQIVLIIHDTTRRTLRLSTNYAQDLGNYLELRKSLGSSPQVIDLRLEGSAFISEE